MRRLLAEIAFCDDEMVSCIIGPEPNNRGAIRAYEKAAFHHLKTVNIPDQGEIQYLMRIAKDDVVATG